MVAMEQTFESDKVQLNELTKQGEETKLEYDDWAIHNYI